jgi:hypothetical protein
MAGWRSSTGASTLQIALIILIVAGIERADGIGRIIRSR